MKSHTINHIFEYVANEKNDINLYVLTSLAFFEARFGSKFWPEHLPCFTITNGLVYVEGKNKATVLQLLKETFPQRRFMLISMYDLKHNAYYLSRINYQL